MSRALEDENLAYIEKLEAHIKDAEQRKKYSLERFDILIISLSSGGLAMTLSIYSDFKDLPLYSIKFAWVAFSLSLIMNLTSQGTGFFANKFDIDCTKQIVEETKGVLEVDTHKLLDKKVKRCTWWTSFLNGACFISLILAIMAIAIFITFKL